jgi:DNA invertase Pin-like site-specific DNA recombinase
MSTSNRQLECEPLIPAVGYLRKSTKGERKSVKGERRQKQEKSLAQQKAEIIKHARGRYKIIRWYEDEGVSGWKREAARPGFARILADARGLRDFRAIVCDDADRFSRASYRKVIRDIDDLAEAGVEIISCVSQGDFRIDDENDAGEAHRLVAVAMASHEYSRKLSRRIALARRDKAEEGKRTGGPAPYGLADDGEGGLRRGDPRKSQLVRWLFDEFGNQLRSLHWLASDLNARAVPGPNGGKWYVKTITGILRNRCYRGDFSFNRNPAGHFYRIDAEGEVVERAKLEDAGKVFLREGAYRPLVEPALFDKVQRRLDTLKDRSRRKRMGYALSGILKCDHCGLPMYGVKPQGYLPAIYRCAADSSHGRGACGYRQVREDSILPLVLQMLGEEIADLNAMLSTPPDNLRFPHKERHERRRQAEKERKDLACRIDKAEANLLFVEDSRTRKSLDARISTMRDELDRLDAELTAEPEGEGPTRDDLAALSAWWDDFLAGAVNLPTRYWMENPDNPDEHLNLTVAVDPRKVNEALLDLGCEVRLRWETQEFISRAGKRHRRHVVTRGRFRLGQRGGELPVRVLEPPAGRSRRAPR